MVSRALFNEFPEKVAQRFELGTLLINDEEGFEPIFTSENVKCFKRVSDFSVVDMFKSRVKLPISA
jgi:hypothetical protein